MQELRAKFSLNVADSIKAIGQLKNAMASGLAGLSGIVNQRRAELKSLEPTAANLGKTLRAALEMKGIQSANLNTVLAPHRAAIAKLKAAMLDYQQHLAGKTAAQTVRRDPFGDTLHEQTVAWQKRQFYLAMQVAKAQRAAELSKPGDEAKASLKTDATMFEAIRGKATQAAIAVKQLNAAKAQLSVMERGVARIETAGSGSIMARITATKQLTAELGRLLSEQIKSGAITKQQAGQTLAPFRAEVNRLRKEYEALRQPMRDAINNARLMRANPPPVIQSGMAGLWQRMKAQQGGGNGDILSTLAGYFGGGRLGGLGGSLGGMVGMAGEGALIGLAVDVAIRSIKYLVETIISGLKDVAEYANRQQALRAQTGLSIRGAGLVSHVSEMVNIDPNAFALWLNRFQGNMGQLSKLSPTTSDSLIKLQRYGLPNFIELRRLKPDEMLFTLAKAFSNVKDATLRAMLAVDLFNRQGGELNRIFQNPQLLLEAITQYGRIGELMSKEIEGSKLQDIMAFFHRATGPGLEMKKKGFWVGMFEELAPELRRIAGVFNSMDWSRLGNLAGAYLKPIVGYLKEAIEFAGNLLKIFKKIEPALAWVSKLYGNQLALPFAAVGGVEKIINGISRGLSYLGSQMARIKTIGKEFWEWLRDHTQLGVWVNLFHRLGDVLQVIKDRSRALWTDLRNTAVAQFLIHAFEKVESIFVRIKGVIGKLIDMVKGMAPAWLKDLIALLKDTWAAIHNPPVVGDINEAGEADFMKYPDLKSLKIEPGDSWSKVGAFSSPGVMDQMPVQIVDMNRKKIELLTAIKNNTAIKAATVTATNGETMTNAAGEKTPEQPGWLSRLMAMTRPLRMGALPAMAGMALDLLPKLNPLPALKALAIDVMPKLGSLPDFKAMLPRLNYEPSLSLGMPAPSSVSSPGVDFSMATAEKLLSTIAANTSRRDQEESRTSTNRLQFSY